MPRKLEQLESTIREVGKRTDGGSLGDDGLDDMVSIIRTFVRDPEQVMMLADSLMHSITRFLIVSADFACDGLPRQNHQDAIEKHLKMHTAITNSGDLKKLRKKLVDVLKNMMADSLDSKQKKKVKKSQVDSSCYICGQPCSEEDDRVDHRAPRNLGGSHLQENLKRVHKNCDLAKWDLAFPSDAPLGRFAFKNAPQNLVKDEELPPETDLTRVRDFLRAGQLRLAVMRRQNFVVECDCNNCSGGRVQLRRIDERLPWWYCNVEAIRECNEINL